MQTPRVSDQNRSIEQIEKDFWGEPPENATSIIERVHELRQRPINEFGMDDVRFMLIQRQSIEHLMPHALKYLEANPLLETRYYPGDLLSAAMSAVAKDYNRRLVGKQISAIAHKALTQIEPASNVPEELFAKLQAFIEQSETEEE